MRMDYRGLSGAFRGSGEAASRYLSQYLLPQAEGLDRRRTERQGAYDQALGDPTGTANLFGDYFRQAAEGFAAPALRDFNNQLAGVRSNTASRFGGGGSSAELKNVYNTSDLFSRNLSESLARLAPQAAGMGLQYTGMLGDAAGQAARERNALDSSVLSGISMFGQPQKKKSLFGSLMGAGLGLIPGVSEAISLPDTFTGG